MRKITALFAALVLVAGLAYPVHAAEAQATQEGAEMNIPAVASMSGIGARWVGTSYVSHGVSIDKSGKSVTSVAYHLYNSKHTVKLSVTLQKLSGSSFSDYANPWSDSGTGNCLFSKTYYVTKGTYRVKTVGMIYDANGKYVETVTLYSLTQTYS